MKWQTMWLGKWAFGRFVHVGDRLVTVQRDRRGYSWEIRDADGAMLAASPCGVSMTLDQGCAEALAKARSPELMPG